MSVSDARRESRDAEPLGEFAQRVRLPNGLSARAAIDALRSLPNVTDAWATDTHVAFACDDDPRSVDLDAVFRAASAREATASVREHVVRVVYDGEDLDEVAHRLGLTRDEVIARHIAATYTVAFVGFLPGFAYLDGLDPRLRLSRRASPRPRVAAGSVAMAGARTAIYPFASPGGWHLLGRAMDFVPFDTAAGATLALGDRVRFEPAT